MTKFDKKFLNEYMEGIREEFKKSKQYGWKGWTVNSEVYDGEIIMPIIIKSNEHYSFFNIEILGISLESNGYPFRIKILSPKEMYKELKTRLEKDLTTTTDKKLDDIFAVEFIISDNMIESEPKNYFTLSE